MKLYSLPLSPFAARVRGQIHAKALPIEIVAPPEDWRSSAEYRALNPFVRVPTLVLEDGTGLPESAVIMDYLEDRFPARPLRPADATGRARMRLIIQAIDVYVMPATLPIFFLMNDPERTQAAFDALVEKLHVALGQLDGLLAAGGHAMGDGLSLADLAVAPCRFILDPLAQLARHPDLLDRHARLKAYGETMESDPILRQMRDEMAEGLRVFMANWKPPATKE